MKKTKFQRFTALMLALTFLLFGGMISVSADESTTDVTANDIKSLLNAISYSEYTAENSDVPVAENEVVVDATKNYVFSTTAGVQYTPDTVIGEDVDKSKLAYVGEFDGKTGLYTPSSGVVTWTIDGISEAAKYSLVLECYPVENKSASIERILMINGDVPFAEARFMTISKIWKNNYTDGSFEVLEGESKDAYLSKAKELGIEAVAEEKDGKTFIKYKMPEYWTEDTAGLVDELALRFFTVDIDLNEIRSSLYQDPEWFDYYFKDANGFVQEPFRFVVGPDEDSDKVTISIECVNEPLVISAIRLVPCKDTISYEEYKAQYAGVGAGKDKIKVESEFYSAVSSQTIYPISDTTSAVTSPVSSDFFYLNTVGGDKWQTSGQWIEYKIKVENSGMYSISTRFKQAVLDGMYTSRALYIYSDNNPGDKGYYNGIPFEEAGRLQFNYSSDWQSGKLTDGQNSQLDIYFEAGVTYTLRFEVTLGNMGDIVRRVQATLDSINDDYLNILRLTGTSPDSYRDYGFSRVMPDTIKDLIIQARELNNISAELAKEAGEKSSMTATLDKVARTLEEMGKDDDAVAKNLSQLKSYIGSLGTWLGDAKTQPLTFDYIVIQGADDDSLPDAKAGFWKAFVYEIKCFIQSFFRNYDRMGAMVDTENMESIEVWVATGRDQSQVLRGLINNSFTPETGTTVDLKLVAAGTLLPSILSGMGPDVYLGLSQNDVINYAIRGALLEVDHLDGFEEIKGEFNEAAMLVLGIENAKGEFHYYGLPETQTFAMMFVREDIFAEFDIDIPKTWDDVKEIIPKLQSNNMQIGMIKDENVFLYQLGGDLFADNGMRINLDSNIALTAFNTMTEMFTMYSFPYSYDFANRFRTGEMPIGFAPYTATYNQLKVFATEIEGLWSFYPMPGYADEETGEINNASVSTITAIGLMNGCENVNDSWKFMKWYAGDQCQVDYANEMIALLGPSAKQATANIDALESMPWTSDEYEQLALQFNNLASIPNYPGRYIVERYTQFAFLAAYNNSADPATELLSYITIINAEVTRKRAEFGLETLESGQTLAQKRMSQAADKLIEIRDSSSYNSSYDELYKSILRLLQDKTTEDYESLRALADELEKRDAGLFKEAVGYIRSAANSLEEYERYK